MKKILASLAASAAIFTSLPAQAGDVLTGDTKLACEAILCLSTGDRPHECAASIKRYFDIRHKKFHKTLEARRNFLNLCPSSNEQNMPDLVNALVNGAGRCDAAELNRVNRVTYTEKIPDKIGRRSDWDYKYVTKSYIRNAKPSYCNAYFEHGWTTVGEKVKYVGNEKEGGRWVDMK
ncbi:MULTISPECIES: TrbM/KikA/MpfK family conjugal transfer protein [unclassified Neisseria]|uniref:TrbM/KikA/MpfK family conjugal transfer protein n=1 Tax=unclassified Neisseria TaxID=2623750 RepID=UPI002665E74C|nr:MULTISPECIES: TrbM/KikA/MpfK family conjugal transfer protein [unclassified Neisseria]MDO1509491.1 TrbM/KikA/MpfK family conjugal transfer protein [Neisseria sp. MVDL19-042950]MDO1515737.1 TrbM/KikA/MpfK family conjugal transfer protein [Neisseria sp. MVDL18-041461]MDO1563439.1 TrbM/KikA/MpfK family conjugal transfer protein [Neisseria sp. MVDL20-010259]